MEVNTKTELEKVNAELSAKLQEIQQFDQRMQQQRNMLVQAALELQGALKLLQHLDGHQPEGEVPGGKKTKS